MDTTAAPAPIVTRKSVIEFCFKHVYTDVEAYTKDIAREHAIANLGQDLASLMQGASSYLRRPETLVGHCFYALQGCEEGLEDACNDEYKQWLKEARKQVKAIQKAGLPLTLQNARDQWEKKGAFAKK